MIDNPTSIGKIQIRISIGEEFSFQNIILKWGDIKYSAKFERNWLKLRRSNYTESSKHRPQKIKSYTQKIKRVILATKSNPVIGPNYVITFLIYRYQTQQTATLIQIIHLFSKNRPFSQIEYTSQIYQHEMIWWYDQIVGFFVSVDGIGTIEERLELTKDDTSLGNDCDGFLLDALLYQNQNMMRTCSNFKKPFIWSFL